MFVNGRINVFSCLISFKITYFVCLICSIFMRYIANLRYVCLSPLSIFSLQWTVCCPCVSVFSLVFRIRIRLDPFHFRLPDPALSKTKNHRNISNYKIRSDQEQDPFFHETYPRIRSRTKMKQIRNTGFHIP